MNRLVLVCSAVVGVSLYFLYALFIGIFLERLVISTVTAIELAIVAAQFVKVAGVVAHYRTRPPRVEILLWLFSLEIVVMILVLVMYTATSSLALGTLFSTIFYTWVGGILLALPPYLVFLSIVLMMRSQSPLQILLLPALVFGLLSFAAGSLLTYANAFSFSTFLPFLLQYADIDLGAGVIPGFDTLVILVPSVMVFCSLVVRVTFPTPTSDNPPRVPFILPLLGVVVGLGWIVEGARAVPNTLLSFTLPGFVIIGVVYAYIRR